MRAVIQAERGGCQQDEETEVRQRVRDELGCRTAQSPRYLNNNDNITADYIQRQSKPENNMSV